MILANVSLAGLEIDQAGEDDFCSRGHINDIRFKEPGLVSTADNTSLVTKIPVWLRKLVDEHDRRVEILGCRWANPHRDEDYADYMFVNVVLSATDFRVGSLYKDEFVSDAKLIRKGDVFIIDPTELHWLNTSHHSRTTDPKLSRLSNFVCLQFFVERNYDDVSEMINKIFLSTTVNRVYFQEEWKSMVADWFEPNAKLKKKWARHPEKLEKFL